MPRRQDPYPDLDPEAQGRPARRLDRVLFLAASLLLISFAVIPLAYQGLVCWQQDAEEVARRLFFEGVARARDGDQEGARRLFRKMIAREGARDAGLAGLAYLELKSGNAPQAEELCDRILAGAPENATARMLKACARLPEDERLQALDSRLDALAAPPGAPNP